MGRKIRRMELLFCFGIGLYDISDIAYDAKCRYRYITQINPELELSAKHDHSIHKKVL